MYHPVTTSSTIAPRTPTAAIQVEPANNGRAWEWGEEAHDEATDDGPQDTDDDVAPHPILLLRTTRVLAIQPTMAPKMTRSTGCLLGGLLAVAPGLSLSKSRPDFHRLGDDSFRTHQ